MGIKRKAYHAANRAIQAELDALIQQTEAGMRNLTWESTRYLRERANQLDGMVAKVCGAWDDLLIAAHPEGLSGDDISKGPRDIANVTDRVQEARDRVATLELAMTGKASPHLAWPSLAWPDLPEPASAGQAWPGLARPGQA